MKILFVDDNESLLELAKTFLEKEDDNFEIHTVSSAKKGLRKLESTDYDAIVSDYQMPEMDGLVFLKNIRENMNQDLPFIVFTGKGREEVAMEALNSGADRYLRKGGNPKVQYKVLASAIKHEVKTYRAEKKQEEMRKEYTDLFNNLNDPVFVHDLEGNFLAVNETAINHLGYSEEELLSMGLEDIDANSFSKKVEKRIEKVREGEDLVFESVHVGKDGAKIPVEINSTLITYRGESAILSVARDVSERKKANRRFRRLYETAPDPIILLDSNGEIKIANEAFYEKIGYEKEDVVGTVLSESEGLTESARKNISAAFSNGSIEPEEIPKNLRFFTREGELRYLETSNSILEVGNEKWCVVITRDVTEKRKARGKLQESIGVYRELLESSPDAIVLTELETRKVIDANKTAEELFGKPRKEIDGTPLRKLHPKGEFKKYSDVFKENKSVDNFEEMNLRILHDSGQEIPVILSGTILEVRGKKVVYCMFRDISKLVSNSGDRARVTVPGE